MLRALRLLLVTFFQTVLARRRRGPARPTWNFQLEWMVRYLRTDWEGTSGWSFARLRADTDARPYPQAVVKKVRTRDAELGGVPVRWFEPPGAREDRVILYFHGGSYIYCSTRTSHADLVARLAIGTGVRIAGVEYRLAPEHPFPAQLDDALAAFDALVAGGTRPEAIVVAGDSAGGNLAIELQLALRDRGTAQARAATLVSPWSDLTMPGRSFTENDPFDYGTREALVRHAAAFAGEAPLDDPHVSPTFASLEGLSPVLVIAGEVEIPRDDILRFADRLEAAGVAVTRHVAPDMPHNAPLFAAYHPSGQGALDAAVTFVKAQFSAVA